MKQFLLLSVFLFFYSAGVSQKTYTFDYLIAYDFQRTEADDVQRVYVMTNSKDNSYSAYLSDSSRKDLIKFSFKDEKGTSVYTSISKKDFFKAETVNIECDGVRFYRESEPRNDDSRYDFTVEKDTLISDTVYKNYTMRLHKRKEEQKYNSGKGFYIIAPGTEFHTPLTLFSSRFDVRKTSTKYPNGIARKMFTINTATKQQEFIYDLVDYAPISKFVIVPKECDFTDPKLQKK